MPLTPGTTLGSYTVAAKIDHVIDRLADLPALLGLSVRQ